ncbi:MAG: indole-3-glycerol phosphate synthase [Proteobacteria bacterium]|nr:MAG: indole-3-glycerol phosphate synthase [Pseudomonadota bacterium]
MNLNDKIQKVRFCVEKKKKDYPYEWLGRSLAYNNYPPRDVLPLLASKKKDRYKIICEILDQDDDFLLTSQGYENARVDALCIDTKEYKLNPNMEIISSIRRYVSIPLLQKGFIIDEYQLLEAVVYGADFVQLIAKILTKKELKDLLSFARRLGLEAMVDVANKEDLTKAIFAGASIIGINHRNLDDLSLDLNLSQNLIPIVPNGKIIIAHGGIDNKEIIEDLSQMGVDGFLLDGYFKEDKMLVIKNLKEKS